MKNVKMIGLVVVLVLTGFGMNTHQVTGVVIDAGTKTPIINAKVSVQGTKTYTFTNAQGAFSVVASAKDILIIEKTGYATKKIVVGTQTKLTVHLAFLMIKKEQDEEEIAEVVMDMVAPTEFKKLNRSVGLATYAGAPEPNPNWNTEEYSTIHENGFKNPLISPLSTFSIDVDAASYSNMRRFLSHGQTPPKDAVRVEEMINYFKYDYPAPVKNEVFSVYSEVGSAPWNPSHKLVHIGVQGKQIETKNLPNSNLVFLLDVSGSMNSPQKLPLLKKALTLLVQELRPNDRVSIVVYAGAAGLVLPPTGGDNKEAIVRALDKLEAGGSTAGGQGIKLAYKIANEQFIEGGNNRIILATDGDFNIGASSNAAMERLVEKERQSGVFLTVLGFGTGNYKDSKMELLADKGNGNYAYIDNILEAKKVLVNEFGGTLFTIAKDVKIQVEFNPALVQAYRLVGYENRLLNDEDFNDDTKDAGELGAGHTVTALYEIVPVGVSFNNKPVDNLKYQKPNMPVANSHKQELMTVKLRYKAPQGMQSKLVKHVIKNSTKSYTYASDNFKWSAAIAQFGMLLRQSEYAGEATYEGVEQLAIQSKGSDKFGYRAEFIRLLEAAKLLAKN